MCDLQHFFKAVNHAFMPPIYNPQNVMIDKNYLLKLCNEDEMLLNKLIMTVFVEQPLAKPGGPINTVY